MSYKIRIVDADWKKIEEKALSSQIFSDDFVSQPLMHEYVVMYLANQRQSTAHTKTRWEVQRSGRKLYRQKWTWRARVGDAWSPIRRKWWVVFGPRKTTDWSKMMPKKMKQKALCGSLTLKAQDNALVAVQWLRFETPKTAQAFWLLTALELDSTKTLLVSTGNDLGVAKSFANIPTITTVHIDTLNAYDILAHKCVLFTDEALSVLESKFTS